MTLEDDHQLVEVELNGYPDPASAEWECSCGKRSPCKARFVGDDLEALCRVRHRAHLTKIREALASGRKLRPRRSSMRSNNNQGET